MPEHLACVGTSKIKDSSLTSSRLIGRSFFQDFEECSPIFLMIGSGSYAFTTTKNKETS